MWSTDKHADETFIAHKVKKNINLKRKQDNHLFVEHVHTDRVTYPAATCGKFSVTHLIGCGCVC